MEFLPDGSPEITELLAFTGYSTFSSDIHADVRARIPQAIARGREGDHRVMGVSPGRHRPVPRAVRRRRRGPVANRTEAALSGIPATPAAIKEGRRIGLILKTSGSRRDVPREPATA